MTDSIFRPAVAFGFVLWLIGPANGQLAPDRQGDMMLSSAQKAFNEGNYPFAATRFREYLGKFPGHKDAALGRFGLALALIEIPEFDRHVDEAAQLLAPLAQDKAFAERSRAALALGVAYRKGGIFELRKGEQTPAEMPNRREAARRRFEQAAQAFAQALPLLTTNAKETPDEPAELAARCRCDLAEMQLRLGKAKEARETAGPLVADPVLRQARCRDFGRYLAAQSAFLLDDIPAAQKLLAGLQHAFADPDFGGHARYLTARTHHLSNERGEALTHYDGVVADHRKTLEHAALMLREPHRFKNNPVMRTEFEATLRRPTPDHVARSNFYLGVLLYEAGRFGEAKARFAEFVKQSPTSPLKADAELRIGFCAAQSKDYADAIKTLQPLTGNPSLADQAHFWIARAQLGSAPDRTAKFPEFKAAAGGIVNTLRAAYEHARRLPDSPEVRTRRGEILLEIADVQLAARDARDAAATYLALLNEKLLPDRSEEIAVRLTQAFHLAGDLNEADARCVAFFQIYPKSTLTPVVAFTYAENALFRAAALEKSPPSPDRDKQLAGLYGETLKRAQVVVDKYPEHPSITIARHAIGMTHYRRGDYALAHKAWSEIPAPDRTGELRDVPLLMADCVLRRTPTTLAADADALAAGKLEDQLKATVELLDSFVSANPKDEKSADALLKLGVCQVRRAGLFGEAKERQAALATARGVFDRLIKEFPSSPSLPGGVFERAKLIAQQGDVNTAINELRRFTKEPLQQSTVAPMAAISLATFLRSQGKPAEAVELMQRSREQFEPPLAKDPSRAEWIALLRLHHGIALRELGKYPESRQAFDSVMKQSPRSAAGIESSLRFGQSLKDEGLARIEAGRKSLANPKEAPQGQAAIAEGMQRIREAAGHLENAANPLKSDESHAEPRARMLYDAAWCHRTLAEPEVAAARAAVAKELAAKFRSTSEKSPPATVAPHQVPLQPSEKKAQELYRRLIDGFGDVPLALDARFELAELLSRRRDDDAALGLLNDVLDREPNVDMTEKVRLHMGTIQAAKGNLKGAMAQFDAVLRNPKSPNLGWATYRMAEALLSNKEYPEAIKRLVLFRDNGQYQNIPGLSDRALLRLGQAYAGVKAWPESYQAFERLVGAFPASPWTDDGRFGMAWALERQGRNDNAVDIYQQIVGRTASELAARAQFRIGECRSQQKRPVDAANAFLAAATTYGYDELTAAALLRAAVSYREANNAEQSTRLFERLIREYPDSPFAAAARDEMKK